MAALEALVDLDFRDFEDEVMAARGSGMEEKGVWLDSGGGHRVDDCVIHHHAAHGGEDVAADQGTVFIETIAAEAPLFDARAIAEGFALAGRIQLFIVLNFTVEADPNPVMQPNSGVLEGVDDILQTREVQLRSPKSGLVAPG